MSEHTPMHTGVEPNGNGGEPAAQMDVAMAQRLRAVTREFSQRELAELTGLSHETVRRYLEGRVPSPVFIKRLCESLGVSADWLLLGRGLPVYQRDPQATDIGTSIDELFEGLSQYLKRLHVELIRAEARLQRAKSSQRLPGEETAGRGEPEAEIKPLPDAVEAAAADFVDPTELGSGDDGGSGKPELAAKVIPPQQIQVRLVLGPLNGRQLVLAEPVSAEVRVRIGTGDRVELVPPEGASAAGVQVYRRVFDRVYRWSGVSRGA